MSEKIKNLIRTKSKILFPGTDTVDCKLEDVENFINFIIDECANQCTTDEPFGVEYENGSEVSWGRHFNKKILNNFKD